MIFTQKTALISLFILNIVIFLYFLIVHAYPLGIVCIQVVSVASFLAYLIKCNITSLNFKKIVLDCTLICMVFLLALGVYLYKIDVVTPGVQSDELTIAQVSAQILSSTNYVPFLTFNYGHPTPLLYLTGVSFWLFGKSVFALRLPYAIFGALTISSFYVLLRLYFKKYVSVGVTLMMLFSYPLIIVSRLAYEVAPSLFFQILTAIYLALAWKKQTIRFYVGLGLSIGGGFYTYLGFRTFALLALLFTLYALWKATLATREKIKRGCVVLIVLFITTTPLLSYSITHENELLARTNSVSIFEYNLPIGEFSKEFLGNVSMLSHVFFYGGDPNVRNNPSAISMFDKGTLILFLIGIYFFLRGNKPLFLVLLFFIISPIVNDIFTLERIPEFHYYGEGHPNTLRIAGIIPILYFIVAYGIDKLKPYLDSVLKEISLIFLYLFVLGIIIFNWNAYFNQPFNGYDYNFNGAITMNVVNEINISKVQEVALSPELLQDERLRFFTTRNVVFKKFGPHSYSDSLNQINENEMTIFDPRYNRQLFQQLLYYAQKEPPGLETFPLLSPLNTIDAVVFVKTQ